MRTVSPGGQTPPIYVTPFSRRRRLFCHVGIQPLLLRASTKVHTRWVASMKRGQE